MLTCSWCYGLFTCSLCSIPLISWQQLLWSDMMIVFNLLLSWFLLCISFTALQLLKKVNFQLELLMISRSFISARFRWMNKHGAFAIRNSLGHWRSAVSSTPRIAWRRARHILFVWWIIKLLSFCLHILSINTNVVAPWLAARSRMIITSITVWEQHMFYLRRMNRQR